MGDLTDGIGTMILMYIFGAFSVCIYGLGLWKFVELSIWFYQNIHFGAAT